MSYTTHARDDKFDNEETEGSIQTASDESGDTDVYGVISQAVSEQLGEYFTIEVSEDDDAVQASRTGETKNFGKYETASRAAYGLGISREVLEDLTGEELPDSIGLTFSPSSQEEYEGELEDLNDSEEEEAEALVAGGSDGSDDEPEEESDEADEIVEISDDELDLEA